MNGGHSMHPLIPQAIELLPQAIELFYIQYDCVCVCSVNYITSLFFHACHYPV